MEQLFGRSQSPLATGIGLVVAGIAFVGTQFLGWEWGSGRLIPTILGVAVAAIAVVFVARRRLGVGD
ncbi:multidrug transporter [Halovenus sp. WSH3]|uniref:Multidrug transporter n=1 Tax=Halovenus carboxidivorans TaxID=2692199 RepID=A0A6B0TA03_9EURY|nr:multidrug transporter [Halovenus carboxidivorans]